MFFVVRAPIDESVEWMQMSDGYPYEILRPNTVQAMKIQGDGRNIRTLEFISGCSIHALIE